MGEEAVLMETNWVDYDFLETYGIELSEGRSFDKSITTDQYACIVNESAIKSFSIKDPLNTRFILPGNNPNGETRYLPIIGITKNFHFESLHSLITPYAFWFKNEKLKDFKYKYISIRISPNASKSVISRVNNTWKEFSMNAPFQYFYLDEDFNRLYKEEQRNSKLAMLFTILAIIVASLGLFGLTSFTIQQRTKEIGIRKAMGASVTSIFKIISKEIIVLVSVSVIIAWPVIYYVSNNWLQNFHYRINLSVFDFITGFVIAVVIALVTISYKTINTARVNPVESLRYE